MCTENREWGTWFRAVKSWWVMPVKNPVSIWAGLLQNWECLWEGYQFFYFSHRASWEATKTSSYLSQSYLSPASSVSIPSPQPASHHLSLRDSSLPSMCGAKSQGISSKLWLPNFFFAPELVVYPCLRIFWKVLWLPRVSQLNTTSAMHALGKVGAIHDAKAQAYCLVVREGHDKQTLQLGWYKRDMQAQGGLVWYAARAAVCNQLWTECLYSAPLPSLWELEAATMWAALTVSNLSEKEEKVFWCLLTFTFLKHQFKLISPWNI